MDREDRDVRRRRKLTQTAADAGPEPHVAREVDDDQVGRELGGAPQRVVLAVRFGDGEPRAREIARQLAPFRRRPHEERGRRHVR